MKYQIFKKRESQKDRVFKWFSQNNVSFFGKAKINVENGTKNFVLQYIQFLLSTL